MSKILSIIFIALQCVHKCRVTCGSLRQFKPSNEIWPKQATSSELYSSLEPACKLDDISNVHAHGMIIASCLKLEIILK